jgi:hypothetical protein
MNKAFYDINLQTAVVPDGVPPDVLADFRTNWRVAGYLGRADILGARMRHHEEEEVRSKGPWLNRPNGWKFWPVTS